MISVTIAIFKVHFSMEISQDELIGNCMNTIIVLTKYIYYVSHVIIFKNIHRKEKF